MLQGVKIRRRPAPPGHIAHRSGRRQTTHLGQFRDAPAYPIGKAEIVGAEHD
jgi:hypothetical protein